MRAAVLRQGRVETRTIEDPVPGPGQVLVRSLACGICASDLHNPFYGGPGATPGAVAGAVTSRSGARRKTPRGDRELTLERLANAYSEP